MNRESFEEVYTYIGKAPKPTPEEMEERRERHKRMEEEMMLQVWRAHNGLNWDGTKKPDEKEKAEYEKRLYEAYLRNEAALRSEAELRNEAELREGSGFEK